MVGFPKVKRGRSAMTRIILASALMVLPTFSLAQSSCAEKHAAESCIEGTQWNSATKTCEQVVSS